MGIGSFGFGPGFGLTGEAKEIADVMMLEKMSGVEILTSEQRKNYFQKYPDINFEAIVETEMRMVGSMSLQKDVLPEMIKAFGDNKFLTMTLEKIPEEKRDEVKEALIEKFGQKKIEGLLLEQAREIIGDVLDRVSSAPVGYPQHPLPFAPDKNKEAERDL